MAGTDEVPPTTPEAIAALVRFLPTFESRAFSPGRWRGGEQDAAGVMHVPWFELSEDARAFVDELGRHGWVFAFDWRAWEHDARRLMEGDALDEADVEDIRRLFTTLVRSDRFVEGRLAWAFESGLIVRILRRLEELAP